MLRTLPQLEDTRSQRWILRLAMILGFTALTAFAAQIEIYIGSPVPFTLQVLVVLLTGLVLGAQDGFLSQVAYLGLIALNLPVGAGGAGSAALTGATAGYLISFPIAAGVAGFLMEHGADRVWQRWLAGVAGIAVIYAFGLPVLKFVTGADWSTAWGWGVAPFLGLDLVKALIAAAITEGSRASLLRILNPAAAINQR